MRAGAAALAVAIGTFASAGTAVLEAQAPRSDKNVALAYEGFTTNDDGSYDLWFGYYNRSWDHAYDVPIGPDNNIEPAGPDIGQPTHFFPRRNQFVFSVRVPADFGESEVVWTLKTDGVTERAYGTLRHLYAVDDVVTLATLGWLEAHTPLAAPVDPSSYVTVADSCPTSPTRNVIAVTFIAMSVTGRTKYVVGAGGESAPPPQALARQMSNHHPDTGDRR